MTCFIPNYYMKTNILSFSDYEGFKFYNTVTSFSLLDMLYFNLGSGSSALLYAYKEIDDGSYPFCR